MTLGGVQVKAESFTTDAETFGIPSNSQKNESSIDRLAVPLDDSEASAMNGWIDGAALMSSVSFPNKVA